MKTPTFLTNLRVWRFRRDVVYMVQLLGSPRSCPYNNCRGCEWERHEAVTNGLIALGYLEPPRYKLDRISTNAAGGECKHWVFDGPQPDPLDAWERFMKGEYGIELSPDWRRPDRRPAPRGARLEETPSEAALAKERMHRRAQQAESREAKLRRRLRALSKQAAFFAKLDPETGNAQEEAQ